MGSCFTTERQDAICELLARHDPIDEHRRHRHVLDGRPDRHNQIPRLALTYIQGKLLALREAESLRHVEL